MIEISTTPSEKLMADLRTVVADAEALLQATAGQAGESAAEMRDKVKASLARAKANLGQLERDALERAKAAGRAADEYVHENPWRSIGIAAGIGLVIGLLISRR
ncbi:DUF883 family protein [Caldimonas sp. KR1-144]|uniref:DUF883 family protein n=1 Tax=Caldimonas sp. KR1-144 TaxID=3400911 RepID=UPI003C043A47